MSTQPTARRQKKSPCELIVVSDCELADQLDHPPLTAEDRQTRRRLEDQMRRGFDAISTAIWQIRTRRLYRGDFKSFEHYAEEFLGVSRVHAHRLADAGRVVKLLSAAGVAPLPCCERQARPLTAVQEDLVLAIWKQAIDEAGPRVTSKVVEQIVSKTLGSKPDKPHSQESDGPSNLERTVLSLTRDIVVAVRAHDLESVLLALEKIRLNIETSRVCSSCNHLLEEV